AAASHVFIYLVVTAHPYTIFFFFFFTASAPSEIYTLSLHDALPICYLRWWRVGKVLEVSAIGVALLLLAVWGGQYVHGRRATPIDRKSTRLNSSHVATSYAVFCLKKKKARPCQLRRRTPPCGLPPRA